MTFYVLCNSFIGHFCWQIAILCYVIASFNIDACFIVDTGSWNSLPIDLRVSSLSALCGDICQTPESLLVLSPELAHLRTIYFALYKCTRYNMCSFFNAFILLVRQEKGAAAGCKILFMQFSKVSLV